MGGGGAGAFVPIPTMVLKWKDQYGGTVLNQLRRLGASLDWSREITPAHDPNNFEFGKRHSLEFINIFTDDGKIKCNELLVTMLHAKKSEDGKKEVECIVEQGWGETYGWTDDKLENEMGIVLDAVKKLRYLKPQTGSNERRPAFGTLSRPRDCFHQRYQPLIMSLSSVPNLKSLQEEGKGKEEGIQAGLWGGEEKEPKFTVSRLIFFRELSGE
ncbi:hypothetical protein E2562_006242 [Oryza meyeriana var. granulata]|uniref:valine--tRNA ligase n=1 Tax=Oryza meyeriana var. granulata TaxID=110450 RepID=A0A6G1CNX7_9ORYZ|nr:hypothetical protein E2562_006242 [Oryza meyeriana var. granulata]